MDTERVSSSEAIAVVTLISVTRVRMSVRVVPHHQPVDRYQGELQTSRGPEELGLGRVGGVHPAPLTCPSVDVVLTDCVVVSGRLNEFVMTEPWE